MEDVTEAATTTKRPSKNHLGDSHTFGGGGSISEQLLETAKIGGGGSPVWQKSVDPPKKEWNDFIWTSETKVRACDKP